jgi:hypothetical protein
MALSIDAIVSGVTANSFGTLAEAESYFETKLETQKPNWLAAADDDEKKMAALISATEWLERLRYQGERTEVYQRLKWPREGVFTLDGDELASNAIPRALKVAQFELAEYLLGMSAPVSSSLDRFESLKLPGGLEIKPRLAASASDQLPAHVAALLEDLLLSGSMLILA